MYRPRSSPQHSYSQHAGKLTLWKIRGRLRQSCRNRGERAGFPILKPLPAAHSGGDAAAKRRVSKHPQRAAGRPIRQDCSRRSQVLKRADYTRPRARPGLGPARGLVSHCDPGYTLTALFYAERQ